MNFFNFSFKNLKEIWQDHKKEILGFYSCVGLPGMAITLIQEIYQEKFLISTIFIIIVIFIPFIYYQKDQNLIRILKKKVVHIRDGYPLSRFEVISYADTTSTIFFKIGSNIKSYYILISKFSDIECSFSLPNDTDFKIIDRDNRYFHIIKCKKNTAKEYQLTINTVNSNRFVGVKPMRFWYKKGELFDNSIKNKKIGNFDISCTP